MANDAANPIEFYPDLDSLDANQLLAQMIDICCYVEKPELAHAIPAGDPDINMMQYTSLYRNLFHATDADEEMLQLLEKDVDRDERHNLDARLEIIRSLPKKNPELLKVASKRAGEMLLEMGCTEEEVNSHGKLNDRVSRIISVRTGREEDKKKWVEFYSTYFYVNIECYNHRIIEGINDSSVNTCLLALDPNTTRYRGFLEILRQNTANWYVEEDLGAPNGLTQSHGDWYVSISTPAIRSQSHSEQEKEHVKLDEDVFQKLIKAVAKGYKDCYLYVYHVSVYPVRHVRKATDNAQEKLIKQRKEDEEFLKERCGLSQAIRDAVDTEIGERVGLEFPEHHDFENDMYELLAAGKPLPF